MRTLTSRGRLLIVCVLAASVVVGCGESDVEDAGDARPTQHPRSALADRFEACLTRAGATITRSASDLQFAAGTTLEGNAATITTDITSVGATRAAVSFMPNEQTPRWRIYTLSERESAYPDPDYETLYQQALRDPEILESVAFNANSTSAKFAAANRCMEIPFRETAP